MRKLLRRVLVASAGAALTFLAHALTSDAPPDLRQAAKVAAAAGLTTVVAYIRTEPEE